jgi:phosphoserine phosphatase RsbU/P
MPTPFRWLPRALLGRIFVLFSASFTLFVIAALAYVQQDHYTRQIDDANESVAALAEIILPTLTDSAVIGDYDTIERILEKATRGSLLSHAEFTDSDGGKLKASNPVRPKYPPPAWLIQHIESQLLTVALPVSAGKREYGTLRLIPTGGFIAIDIWTMTRSYVIFAALFLLPGLLLVRIPMKMMVDDLAQAARFAANLKHHHREQLVLDSTTFETESLIAALNQVSRELTLQHEALAESEARKSAILAAGLDCFITIDADGHIIDFNRAAEQTFGYTADEVRGRVMSEIIIPPELRPQHEQGMEHWHLTGEGPVLHQRIEITAMRRSGEIFPVELAVVPFGSGDRQYFAGFIRDISRRKSLEMERHNLEVAQRQMVADLAAKQFAIDQHALVSIASPDGTILYANDRLQTLSGYSQEELVGNNHRLLNSGLHEAAFFRNMWSTIINGNVWHGEYANRRKNGEIYWVAATIVPMSDQDGKPHQFISIQTDITQQKLTERQLSQSQVDLLNLLDQYRVAEVEIAQNRARELMAGSQIQRTLLFGKMPWQNGILNIAPYTQPSQVIDGDFYEFFSFDENTFDIAIGDVMGKGIPAALMGAAVKKQLNRSIAWLLSRNLSPGFKPAPGDIINDLHRRVCNELLDLDSFVTLAYLRIDTVLQQAWLVDAGHLPLIHASDKETKLIRGVNLPLGILQEEVYQQQGIAFELGDIFFMYSDGITEARNASKEEFGFDRLLELVREMHACAVPPSIIVQNVRWHVNEFEDHVDPNDDRTCVALQISRPRPDGVLVNQFELPRALNQLTPLRKKLEIAGAAAGFTDEAVQALVIAAFEAATNIVRHTPPRLVDDTIHCAIHILPRRLELDLHYLGNAFTPLDREPDFSGKSEGGFGLYIIRNSVDEVEYSSPFNGICRIRMAKIAQETAS